MYRRTSSNNGGNNNNINNLNTINSNSASNYSSQNNNQSSTLSSSFGEFSSYNQISSESSVVPKMTGVISCKDRTSEFHSTVRSFQSRLANNPQQMNDGSKGPKNKSAELLQQRHQFMQIAKKIGRDLTNTCIKLEKLTDLAKKPSLFDDKPKEIEDLTFLIKQDLNNLNSEISRLQEFVKATQNRDSKNMQKHSSNIVYSLQSKLINVSKDFKQVLEVRNENLKQQTERGQQFFSKNTLNPSSAASIFAPPKIPGSSMGKSVLLYDSSLGQQQTNSLDSKSAGETILNMDLMQKQTYQQRLIVNQEESFIRDRANAMQTVEQTIVELGTMFQQLATMIKEQEEQIQRIDSNVDDVDLNVSAAHSELLKYFQSVTSNRWLMIKIFLVLITFFVIFIVVMT